ncbi:uncharacterized protein LOC113375750 [Ctenocephalides felis]|uniref:uncharacterized protein LOC113375750 n=1 Tax=Ctenocephalides felis TaxID=7515 RepID=UPI000E6E1512|nr:uncharacterized protein LOC113375750 [Ctenocephalides felis]
MLLYLIDVLGGNCKLLQYSLIKRRSALTPRRCKMYDTSKILFREVRRINKQCNNSRDKLQQSIRCSEKFSNIPETLNVRARNFILSQLREHTKRPKGRKFTEEDKILALSLYKKSPKAYYFWRQIFILPSPQTLRKLLSEIPLYSGINECLFNTLSSAISHKKYESSKYCVLMFDEISLSSELSYDRKKDHIVGFVELANGRKSLFADHALVFMIKGIKDRWKQPVALYFSEGGVNSSDLKYLIVDVAKKLFNIGLKVVATVCDQYAANCKAVNMLLNDTEEYYKTKNLHWNKLFFEIDGHEIVPLYDPPHLLKCMRNNFAKYNVKFIGLDGVEYEASWKDIIDYYNHDSTSSMFRRCPTLTEHHLDQTKMKRMKVSLAAQVFSQRVAHGLQNSGYQ